jgi:hypothetical protein
MSIEEKQLRANIISLYGGYESEIPELAQCFGISEKQVRQYIEEENKLHRELYGENLWENKEISIKGEEKMPNEKGNVKGNVKKSGIEVKDLAKTVAEAAAGIVDKAKAKDVPQDPKATIKGAVEAKVPREKVKQGQLANETMIISTRPPHVPDIRAIANSVSLKAIDSKTRTPSGKEVTIVKIDVLAETLRKLKELKKVLGSNLPTAINRVELDPNGLVFDFYVKYGRGPIYVKRATKATGLVCKSAPAKKKTTAGDMRSVHLVTLKITASKIAATQTAGLWKLLKYSIKGIKA